MTVVAFAINLLFFVLSTLCTGLFAYWWWTDRRVKIRDWKSLLIAMLFAGNALHYLAALIGALR